MKIFGIIFFVVFFGAFSFFVQKSNHQDKEIPSGTIRQPLYESVLVVNGLIGMMDYFTENVEINNQTTQKKSKQVAAVLPKGENMKYKGKTVTQRSDGRWWTRYYKNGKQFSVYGKTQI